MIVRRVFWVIALAGACVLGGCATEYDAANPPSRLEMLGAVGLATAAHADMFSLEGSGPEPKMVRRLELVRGRLVNQQGLPVEDAVITYRVAPRYMAHPEKLPVKVVGSGANGTFELPMSKVDFLCVDFAAPGMIPVRRWYVLATPAAGKRVPKGIGDIDFVAPEKKVAVAATFGLVPVDRLKLGGN